MRPEVIAFRELNTLVRNLTDQLAGYRRRALASEARAKELEESLARITDELVASRNGQLEAEARLAARSEGDPESGDMFPGVTLPTERRERSAVLLAADGGDRVSGADTDIVEENQRLRSRLGEARERTVMLVERVRFLRQQMSLGGDR